MVSECCVHVTPPKPKKEPYSLMGCEGKGRELCHHGWKRWVKAVEG